MQLGGEVLRACPLLQQREREGRLAWGRFTKPSQFCLQGSLPRYLSHDQEI